MLRHPRVQFILIIAVLLTSIAGLLKFRIHPGIDLAGGAELRYKVLFEPGFKGDRKQATRAATDVLRRRIENDQLQEPKISSYGDDGIVIQLAGVDADRLREVKRRVRTLGKLELYAAAPPDLQEQFARDGIVPAGTRIVRGRSGAPLLVQQDPVIEGRHIVNAEPIQDFGSEGGKWVTSFQLDAEGAKRFDEAAEKLYTQQPRGRIVIMLDGELRSAPAVQSPAFHGRGQISGGRD